MFRLLVVDDNHADRELLKILLKRVDRPHEVYFATDGMDALDFLHCRGPYFDAPRPNLLLLDLNMPRMNGLDLLKRLKADPEFRVIPVVMFSSSASAGDIRKAYEAHANCYVQKPANLDRAHQLIQALEAFWMDVAILPPCEERQRETELLSAL